MIPSLCPRCSKDSQRSRRRSQFSWSPLSPPWGWSSSSCESPAGMSRPPTPRTTTSSSPRFAPRSSSSPPRSPASLRAHAGPGGSIVRALGPAAARRCLRSAVAFGHHPRVGTCRQYRRESARRRRQRGRHPVRLRARVLERLDARGTYRERRDAAVAVGHRDYAAPRRGRGRRHRGRFRRERHGRELLRRHCVVLRRHLQNKRLHRSRRRYRGNRDQGRRALDDAAHPR